MQVNLARSETIFTFQSRKRVFRKQRHTIAIAVFLYSMFRSCIDLNNGNESINMYRVKIRVRYFIEILRQILRNRIFRVTHCYRTPRVTNERQNSFSGSTIRFQRFTDRLLQLQLDRCSTTKMQSEINRMIVMLYVPSTYIIAD